MSVINSCKYHKRYLLSTQSLIVRTQMNELD